MAVRYRTDEPTTITTEVVADFLECRQCPRMAAFVRGLGQLTKDANQRASAAIASHNELLKRLQVYEPPVPEPETLSGGIWTGD